MPQGVRRNEKTMDMQHLESGRITAAEWLRNTRYTECGLAVFKAKEGWAPLGLVEKSFDGGWIATYDSAPAVHEVRRLALLTAERFAEEFPGQSISGNWDVQAWEMDQRHVDQEYLAAYGEQLWNIYHAYLHNRVNRKLAQTG
jgi:hypothetical protein